MPGYSMMRVAFGSCAGGLGLLGDDFAAAADFATGSDFFDFVTACAVAAASSANAALAKNRAVAVSSAANFFREWVDTMACRAGRLLAVANIVRAGAARGAIIAFFPARLVTIYVAAANASRVRFSGSPPVQTTSSSIRMPP